MGASPYLSHLPLADVSSTLAKSTTPAVAGSMRRIPGVTSRGPLRLPRAVFWRPFRALIPIAKSTTPATSGVYSPLHAINARHVGRLCTKLYINPTKWLLVFPERLLHSKHDVDDPVKLLSNLH